MPETPLRELHNALVARFTSCGDWYIPLQYQSVVTEYLTVRRSAATFDIGYLGCIARREYALRSGRSSGVVTSGNVSPVLGSRIGMGYLAPPPPANSLEMGLRDEWQAVSRIDLPFIER